jgi:hypothetical protein
MLTSDFIFSFTNQKFKYLISFYSFIKKLNINIVY